MQVMYNAWCRVIDVIAKFPASCYDSSIKSQLSENLLNNSPILEESKTHHFVAPTEQQICMVLASLKISIFLCRKKRIISQGFKVVQVIFFFQCRLIYINKQANSIKMILFFCNNFRFLKNIRLLLFVENQNVWISKLVNLALRFICKSNKKIYNIPMHVYLSSL